MQFFIFQSKDGKDYWLIASNEGLKKFNEFMIKHGIVRPKMFACFKELEFTFAKVMTVDELCQLLLMEFNEKNGTNRDSPQSIPDRI